MSLSLLKKPLLTVNGPRRLPTGIGRGIQLEIDFALHTRLYAGLYEIELNSSLRRLCVAGVPSFDVGANIGYDTLVLAKISSSAVMAFECEPALAERMKRNLALNPRLAEQVRLLRTYVDAHSDSTGGRVSLDDVAFGANGFVPGFVKIDVEGAEADVLRGARRLLTERQPGVIVETHDSEVERACMEILREHGYSPRVVNRRSWLRDRRPTAHNRWLVATGR